jgi:hypothetical protein
MVYHLESWQENILLVILKPGIYAWRVEKASGQQHIYL